MLRWDLSNGRRESGRLLTKTGSAERAMTHADSRRQSQLGRNEFEPEPADRSFLSAPSQLGTGFDMSLDDLLTAYTLRSSGGCDTQKESPENCFPPFLPRCHAI